MAYFVVNQITRAVIPVRSKVCHRHGEFVISAVELFNIFNWTYEHANEFTLKLLQ